MSLQVEKLEHNMAKLTIEVSAEEVEKALQAAYLKERSKISLPGFRKGKVPRQMIEKMYGPEVFYDEAANRMISEAYAKAYDESELEIASQPTIDIVQLEKGKPFIFTAEVAVKPEVTLGEYKGVEVEKVDAEVTDEDVQAELLNVQKQNSRTIPVEDRAAKMDDEVTIDFEGFVDGEAFEGGKGENYQLTLGSHSFIDTFEDQIVGKNIGEEFDVNVTFPEDYQAEELKGKAAVFKCTIKEIKEKELPALDDEFASEVSEFDTLEEYKKDVKETLTIEKEKAAREAKEAAVIDAIIADSDMDIPEAMVTTQQKQMIDEFAQRMQMQGLSMEQYFQFTGATLDKMMEQVKPQAETRIKSRLVLEAVAAKEGIEATEEDYEEEIKTMAEVYQMEPDKIKEMLPEKSVKGIKEDIAVKKAAEFVVNNAKAK